MPRLIISTGSGSDPGRTVDLGTDVVSIGRDAGNTIPLDTEGKASRRHCQVAPVSGNGWEVVDNQSTNGTRVNGAPVDRRRLRHGDVIEVGLTKIRFEDERAVASGEASACYLEWTAGDRKGERVPLAAARTSFGRRESNTVVLADKMASSHHAEIVRDLNGYTIRDLGSTNGTLVNGTPVTETALTHGARVRIGGAKFVFKDPAMKDVEVALEGLEEDDGGWGMMSELDVSRGGGGAGGVIAAVLLIGALAAGAFVLGNKTSDVGGTAVDTANLLTDGGFDGEESVAWIADEGVPATAARATSGGRAGRGGFLAVRHDGRGAGRAVVRSVDDLDLAPTEAYKVSGFAQRSGAGRAYLGIQWVRGASTESGATAVTQTVPVGEPEKAGAWTPFESIVRRPAWARRGRLVVVVSPDTGFQLDDVRLEAATAPAPAELTGARGYEPSVSATGGLDVKRTATALLVGASPWAKLGDGRVVGGADAFRVDGPATAADGGVAVKGRLVDDQGGVPATVTWKADAGQLTASVEVPGATEVGLAADFPRAHLEDGLGVLAPTGAVRVSPEAGANVDGAKRVLLGTPQANVELKRPPTLVALDVTSEGATRAATVEAADPVLVRVVVSAAGPAATFRVVTDFDPERQQAQADLQKALSLAQGTPGPGLTALDAVGQRYPFDEEVVRRAREAAQRIAAAADDDVAALDRAVERFTVFGDEPALKDAERRAAALALQFPRSSTGSPRELYVETKAAELRALRTKFDLGRAAPEVNRLVRLAELLEQEAPAVEGDPDLKVIALAYYDTVVARYGDLEAAAAQGDDQAVVDKIKQARARRDALMGDATVSARFPK